MQCHLMRSGLKVGLASGPVNVHLLGLRGRQLLAQWTHEVSATIRDISTIRVTKTLELSWCDSWWTNDDYESWTRMKRMTVFFA